MSGKHTGLDGSAQPSFLERHFSVNEIAELWGLSRDTIIAMFEQEAGVMVVGSEGSRNARRYRTLRIPQSVMERVHLRLCNPRGFGRTPDNPN